ncbi:MAG: peptide chain release factor N(5)-glutamine methyltransferase [Nitrospirales bacterium]|nr:peptide chain release factor N(5)-glutamine methyltransferase [Nitrospirales bacterium]
MPPKMSYSQLFEQAVAILSRAGISHAEREALWILEYGLHVTRLDLLTQAQEVVNQDDCKGTLELLARRATREPLQYVLGTQDFCGREFLVEPGVLIPRPETELVVEEALACMQDIPRPLVVDVGTGSGCLAISVAGGKPDATVVVIDQSMAALQLARTNAVRHGVHGHMRWVNGDLLTPLLSRETEGKVTAIVANLPYISQAEWERLPPDVKDFEPRLALYGGPDGFDLYRRLFAQVSHVLTPEGGLVIEIGMGQIPLVEQAVSNVGTLKIANVRQDGQGIPRVVCLQPRTE